MLTVHEVAALAGVSVRTLHYYDETGLLRPTSVTGAGYRLYDDAALERLQQILFLRELDFPLKEIAKLLDSSGFDRLEAIRSHRELLTLKRKRIDGLIELCGRMLEGETGMSFREFDESAIKEAREKYRREAESRWGNTQAYKESERRADSRSKAEWADMEREADEIFSGFAALVGGSPASAEARAMVERWKAHIDRRHYPITDEILKGLGEMYAQDERFAATLDRHGKGTAAFMSAAIAQYTK